MKPASRLTSAKKEPPLTDPINFNLNANGFQSACAANNRLNPYHLSLDYLLGSLVPF